MGHFIDLDAVARPDIRVQLGGREYVLPGDLKVPTMLRLMELDRVSKEGDEGKAQEAIDDLYEEILDIFRVHQPEVEELPISFEQVGHLFGELFTVYTPQPEDEADPDRPTPAPSRATTKRKNSRRSASRSPRPKKSPSSTSS